MDSHMRCEMAGLKQIKYTPETLIVGGARDLCEGFSENDVVETAIETRIR